MKQLITSDMLHVLCGKTSYMEELLKDEVEKYKSGIGRTIVSIFLYKNLP